MGCHGTKAASPSRLVQADASANLTALPPATLLTHGRSRECLDEKPQETKGIDAATAEPGIGGLGEVTDDVEESAGELPVWQVWRVQRCESISRSHSSLLKCCLTPVSKADQWTLGPSEASDEVRSIHTIR